MIDRKLALPLATLGLVLVEGMAVSLAIVAPDRLRTALVAGLTLPALWGAAEMFRGDKASVRFAIAAAAALLAVPLGAKLGQGLGWIAPDNGDLMSRLFGIAGGLILAAYGNVIPRQLDRYDPLTSDPGRWQRQQRRAAWAFVLAGLACAMIWVVLPVRTAAIWSIVPVALSIIVVFPLILVCVLGRKKA